MKTWIDSFINLFSPHCCIVCKAQLYSREEKICLKCDINLPRTNYHLIKDNAVEKLLWGRIPLERATSFLFYRRGSEIKEILYQIKYKGNYELAITMGKQIACELSKTGFLDGIDMIIPVPLHKNKQKKRGYNQSEQIAFGISAIKQIPVDNTCITRIKDTETQTQRSAPERWENVEGIFHITNPDEYSNKHILLIDDVLTTGSTLTACAIEFRKVPDIIISVFTLAMAQQ